MHVAYLSLTDFRSYAAVEFALGPGVTTFLGPNGQGKTNLVEAVGYLASHGSHRVAGDAPLVRQGAAHSVVRARVVKDGREALVELEINPGRANRAQLNRSPVSRPRDVLGLLRSVLFAPEDLALVKGDPSERRRFLDDLLVARAPRFAGVRADYERVLKQRNALLRSAVAAKNRSLATLDVWDAHLSRLGGELLAARLDLVAALGPLVAKGYAALAPSSDRAELEYRASVDYTAQDRESLAAALQAGLNAVRKGELERGVTLAGPHRDELLLRLGEMPARGYASHGESWSFALALRLASYELLRADTGDDPVLILDDVFAELDSQRRARLAEYVAPAEQVLVTAAVPDDVPAELDGVRFDVAEGVVARA